MQGTSTTCDVCGRVKGETNHWLVAVSSPICVGVMYVPAECISNPRWPEYIYLDICGHGCASKHFAAWLADTTATQQQLQEDACQK